MPELPELESRLKEFGLELSRFALQLPCNDSTKPGNEDARYLELRHYLGTRNVIAATAISQVNATTREVTIQTALFVGATANIAVCGQNGSINRGPSSEQFVRELAELMQTEVTPNSGLSHASSALPQTLWIGHGSVPKTPLRIAAALNASIECGVTESEHAFMSSPDQMPLQISGFGDLESYPVLAFVKTATQRRIELTLDDSITPHIVLIQNQEFEAVSCAVSSEQDAQNLGGSSSVSTEQELSAHKLLETLEHPAFLKWADTIPSEGVTWITQKEDKVYTRGLEKYHLLHREAATLVTVPRGEFFVNAARFLGLSPSMQKLVLAFENGSTTPFEDAGIEPNSIAFPQRSKFSKDIQRASLNSILSSYNEFGHRRRHWWQRAFHSPKIRWPLALVFMCSGVFLTIDAIGFFGSTALPILQSVLRSALCFCIGAQILTALFARRRINKALESVLKGNNELQES